MEKINWLKKEYNKLIVSELYDMMTLRQVVFVVEQNCPYLDADGRDQYSHHLMGYPQPGLLVAYTRIVNPGIVYQEASIGRVIIAQNYRNIGLGIVLMEESMKYAAELYGDVPIRISAQVYLKKFYTKFGFEQVSDSYLEDGIPHIEMLVPSLANFV